MIVSKTAAVLAAGGLVLSGPWASAQQIGASGGAVLADSASPFGPTAMTAAERASIAMPKLDQPATAEDAKDFDKYYLFHRDGADFVAAYADVSECDGYARGLRSSVRTQPVYTPYAGTMAGAVGGAIGSAMAAAIFGSAEKRRMRRINMRTCMHYKGYSRHGVSKDVWKTFNFEEGLGSVPEEDRRRMLGQQALVASSARPLGAELGL